MYLKKSFTFIEILVAAVILATSLAGMLATFVTVRQMVADSNRRAVAHNLVRERLESLYKEVDANTWDLADQPLMPGQHPQDNPPPTLDGVEYDRSYTVADGPSDADYRVVTVTVTYEKTQL